MDFPGSVTRHASGKDDRMTGEGGVSVVLPTHSDSSMSQPGPRVQQAGLHGLKVEGHGGGEFGRN